MSDIMVEMRSCAIIIPIYQHILNVYEMFSVKRNMEVLSEYPIIFLMSDNIDEDYYKKEFPSAIIKKISHEFFQGYQSYNRLMLSSFFYDLWQDYQKILICQTDAVVLSNRLAEFVALDYDYIGAPLFRIENDAPVLYVGNGGCSLRNVKVCASFIQRHSVEVGLWQDNEDEFFSHYGKKYSNELKLAPVRYAASFVFDKFRQFLYEYNNNILPFALHGWYTYDAEYSCYLLNKENVADVPENFPGKVSIVKQKLKKFLQSKKYIVLYGAGVWGKVLIRYLKKYQARIVSFVISDDQPLTVNHYLDIPIYHLSLLPYSSDEVAVLIAISPRTTPVDEYNSILDNVKARGFGEIFSADIVLYNAAIESWLLDYWNGGNDFGQ